MAPDERELPPSGYLVDSGKTSKFAIFSLFALLLTKL